MVHHGRRESAGTRIRRKAQGATMYAKTTGMLGLVAVLAAGCVGCETPRSGEVSGEESSQDAPVEGSVAVVERAAALRDRAFDVPVKVEVLDAGEVLERSGALPEAVEAERARLSRGLYGDAGALKLEVDRSWGSRAGAEVGEREVQVRQVGRQASARWASAVAASRALEKGAFGELAPASTVDGWLACEVVLSAGPMLASTLAVAEADGMAI